uniref:Uncharacterized protein n=2 Tax=Oryza sativa subsp. japonica TaxID=39947 RepID=Q10HC7_ORYSJ|nr:hypothetical protein [Oryza sativa Japonica Group]ABF97416.1 hypothetical protein LOC_Os03g39620 [Oryza sativa Japonica Group]
MTAALQALLDPTALSLGLPTPVINKEVYLAICLTVLAGTRAGKALVGKAVLGVCVAPVRNLESPPTVELANRQSQRTRGVNDALPLSLVRSCRLTPSPPDTCHAPDLILSGPPCWWEWETSRRCSHVGLQAVVPEVASGGAHRGLEATLRNIVRRPLAFLSASGSCGPANADMRHLIARLLAKDPAARLGSHAAPPT